MSLYCQAKAMPGRWRRHMRIRTGLVLFMMTLPFPALAGADLSGGFLPSSFLPKSFLPKGFVYLRDTDPTIVEDIRYAGSHNFVGRPIEGYLAAECILSERAASALKTVQRMLAEKNLSLIVWDCYRPQRAVDDFWGWSKDPTHSEMKAEFYPRTDKQKLFALGYLARRSAHSRGSTVDLGIVPSSFAVSPPPHPVPAVKPSTLKP
jgi:zinc D-Ala-D-Ala dipeptidase